MNKLIKGSTVTIEAAYTLQININPIQIEAIHLGDKCINEGRAIVRKSRASQVPVP